MAKMFYKVDEAAAKLKITVDELKEMVASNKLREFRDGQNVMFKVDQVDRLANTKPSSSGDSGMQLADDGGDAISLADSVARTPAKEDTVMTSSSSMTAMPASQMSSAGSTLGKAMVFDETEVKSGDSGAKTHITPAVEDQLALEGVGSGSGLLDLTRESDDTSLGAELLDEIYPGGDTKSEGGIGSASGIFEQPMDTAAGGSSISDAVIPATVPVAAVDYVEEADPTAGAFGGMALAAMLVMGATLVITAATYSGFSPDWLESMTTNSTNLYIFAGILVVVAGLFAVGGLFVGKASAR